MDSSQAEVKQHQTNSTQWTDGVTLLSRSTGEAQPHNGVASYGVTPSIENVDVCAHVEAFNSCQSHVCVCPSVFTGGFRDLAGEGALLYITETHVGSLCNNNSTSISL